MSSEALAQKRKSILEKLNTLLPQLSKVSEISDTKEANKIRRNLLRQKSELDIQLRFVNAEIRVMRISQDKQLSNLRMDLVFARELLGDSLKLISDIRKCGFDNLKAVEYANITTAFLLGAADLNRERE